jgi:hypothetical protein
VFIRVKARKTKTGETWDFRLVESVRVPGSATPRQRVVVSLGSLRAGESGGTKQEAERFRESALAAIRAKGVQPSAETLRQLDALIQKRNASLPLLMDETVRSAQIRAAVAAFCESFPGGARGGRSGLSRDASGDLVSRF